VEFQWLTDLLAGNDL